MASITMWRHGERRCVLFVTSGEFNLHLFERDTLVQKQRTESADIAVRLSAVWEHTHAHCENAQGTVQ